MSNKTQISGSGNSGGVMQELWGTLVSRFLQRALWCMFVLMFSLPLNASDNSSTALISLQVGRVNNWLESVDEYARLDDVIAARSDLVELARQLAQQADVALERNDAPSAYELGNRALQLFGRAMAQRQSLPEMKLYKKRSRSMRREITTFRADIEQRLAQGGQHAELSYNPLLLESLMADASQLETVGSHKFATELFNQAYTMVVSSLSLLRDKETLVRSINFTSPREAFLYEKSRYADYYRLAKYVVRTNYSAIKSKTSFQNGLGRGEQSRQQAIEHYRQGDHAVAIRLMESATKDLKMALNSAGVNDMF